MCVCVCMCACLHIYPAWHCLIALVSAFGALSGSGWGHPPVHLPLDISAAHHESPATHFGRKLAVFLSCQARIRSVLPPHEPFRIIHEKFKSTCACSVWVRSGCSSCEAWMLPCTYDAGMSRRFVKSPGHVPANPYRTDPCRGCALPSRGDV